MGRNPAGSRARLGQLLPFRSLFIHFLMAHEAAQPALHMACTSLTDASVFLATLRQSPTSCHRLEGNPFPPPHPAIFNQICSESKWKSLRIGVHIDYELLEQVSLYKESSRAVFPIPTELKP
jgi:hypothetical protein